jgi:hypothetical protein
MIALETYHGASCEGEVIAVSHDIAGSLDSGGGIDATIINNSRAFAL